MSFYVVDVVGKNGMGAYTHITLNQRQEVAYCHS